MSRPQTPSKKIRLNLEISEQVNDSFTALQRRSGAESRSEVIRRALGLFDTLLEYREKGAEIVIRMPDGRERLLVLS